MQDRHLCCPPTFSLDPQWPPYVFHSRIATDCVSSLQSAEGIPYIFPKT